MIATEPRTGTKERILDSAELLFATHGFAATSLRNIISDAKVNLAAVHYHFKSKEALLDAILIRRLGPINRERLERLDAAGPAATVEQILEAFIAPAVGVSADPERGGKPFVRLMARIISDDSDLLPRVLREYFGEVIQKFSAALHRALPDLPMPELFWRMHFTAGAMAHTLRAGQDMALISAGQCDTSDVEMVTRRLVGFLAAGFRSPVPPVE
jgi:AcrR family transcriptional regulator